MVRTFVRMEKMVDARRPYDEKLAHILRSAAKVFARRGYHQASIRDISRETGVSLSGLYYYFRSKDELLFQIQMHCFATVLANAERALAEVKDPRLRLRLFVANHLRFFAGNMDEMKVLSHEAESLEGEYREQVSATRRRYTELCAGIVRELAPSENRMDLRVATLSLFGMMNWIYNWYHPDRDVPVEELAETMSRLFLCGFLSGGEELPALADAGADGGRTKFWRH